jgi:hypothetical protein
VKAILAPTPAFTSQERFDALQAVDNDGRSALAQAWFNEHFDAMRVFVNLVTSERGEVLEPEHRLALLLGLHPCENGRPLLLCIANLSKDARDYDVQVEAIQIVLGEAVASESLPLLHKVAVCASMGREGKSAARVALDNANPEFAAMAFTEVCTRSPDALQMLVLLHALDVQIEELARQLQPYLTVGSIDDSVWGGVSYLSHCSEKLGQGPLFGLEDKTRLNAGAHLQSLLGRSQAVQRALRKGLKPPAFEPKLAGVNEDPTEPDEVPPSIAGATPSVTSPGIPRDAFNGVQA